MSNERVEQNNIEVLDLNEFKDSKELLRPLLDKMVFISLSTVRFEDLARWYRIRDYQHVKPDFEKPMFGHVLEFNTLDDFISGIPAARYPEKLEINNDYAGVTVHEGNLVACNGSKLEVFSPEGRKTITHPLFNDVKFVDFSDDGKSVLVCASGTDSLLEFSYPEMKLTWVWFAPEHGYSLAPDGTQVITTKMLNGDQKPEGARVLDDGTDYSKVEITTSSQTTHINSATYLDGKTDKIAITLFQPGHAVILDKKAETTELVKDGLSRPHGFYKFGGDRTHYVITSPTTGVIDILDGNYRPTHAIKGVIRTGTDDRTWLQNTFPISDEVLALVDHYNYHVVFFNIFTKEKQVVETHKQWKIFQIALQDQLATKKAVLSGNK
jgi:hypothetical protein